MHYNLISIILIFNIIFSTPEIGNYLWPSDASETITTVFGDKRSRRFHAGIDVRTYGNIGSEIYAIQKGYIKESEIASISNTTHSMLNMPSISKEEISGLARTFSYYVKFPKNRWDEIKLAEQFTPEGDLMHKKLGAEFDQKYRTEAGEMPDLHD